MPDIQFDVNYEHLSFLLNHGVAAWNYWREQNPIAILVLSGANLSRPVLATTPIGDQIGNPEVNSANFRDIDLDHVLLEKANLEQADFCGAHFQSADMQQANLSGGNFYKANFARADLAGAKLRGGNFQNADFQNANLRGADLRDANFTRTMLYGADLSHAQMSGTILTGSGLWATKLVDIDLGNTRGLDACTYSGPSFVDCSTLYLSENLPLSFLRGCGLPEIFIEYLPSLRNNAMQYYSLFISYSSKDQAFANRLHADLQNVGVRCWFAPHDLPIGAKTWDSVDEAIRLRDKLLVILSQSSISSDWVEDEVTKAYAEERERRITVLFPIRIDDSVMKTDKAWARKLRDQRNIGNFRGWRSHTRYQRSLERLLHDLRATGVARN